MNPAMVGTLATILAGLFGYLAARLTRKTQAEAAVDTRWQAMLDKQQAHFDKLLAPLYKRIESLESDLAEVSEKLDIERAQFKTAIRFIRELLGWITHHAPGVQPPVIPTTLKDEM